jgi:hypothetical protein
MASRNPSGVVSAGSSKLKTSADTIAAMPLIGNEVGIVAVRELIAMVVCTENLIRVDGAMESPKLAE